MGLHAFRVAVLGVSSLGSTPCFAAVVAEPSWPACWPRASVESRVGRRVFLLLPFVGGEVTDIHTRTMQIAVVLRTIYTLVPYTK